VTVDVEPVGPAGSTRAADGPPEADADRSEGTRAPVERADIGIVGAGILGLATALRLLQAHPGLRVALVEKEPGIARHQTGHNSGVVHAGLYYTPGSLKARLCREGKRDLEAYCDAHGIVIDRTGKLVIALDESELPALAAIRDRATANGVPGLEEVGPERIRELEPHAAGIRALWSPSTGIVDFRAVAHAYADDIVARGATIDTSRAVTAIDPRGDELAVRTTRGDLVVRRLIVCAGLQADRVAGMTGDATPDRPRIVPFRGDYYTLRPEARRLVRGLIYPVPDPRFPFLGVHFTKRIDGAVLAGPNAVLALAREGYRRTDLSVRDLADALAYPGFVRLGVRYWRTGLAEMWRDVSKRSFLASLRRYVPELRAEDLRFGPSGVRAQALARDGALVDDFMLGGSDRVLHVVNAPSPAATSPLAIGRVLADEATTRFGL
jgi:L-2-hydroxyglutarate oxidase LhgO